MKVAVIIVKNDCQISGSYIKNLRARERDFTKVDGVLSEYTGVNGCGYGVSVKN